MTIFLVEFQGGLRRALHTELVLKPLILFSVGRTYPWSEIKASHTPLSTDVSVCVCVCVCVCIFSHTVGNPHVGDESSKSICF